MWPFKTKPPETFPFNAAMMCASIQNGSWASFVIGFERKLMHKDESAWLRARVMMDVRPTRFVVAEESGPFFIINSIQIDGMEQMAACGLSLPASVFANDDDPYCEFTTARMYQYITLHVTCIGRPTLGQRARRFLTNLWYGVKFRTRRLLTRGDGE